MNKKIIVLFALLALLSFTSLVFGQDVKYIKPDQHKVLFKNGMSKKELTDFVNKYKLNIKSITFQGKDFACGGTVNSIEEYDSLVNEVMNNWENDLKQKQIPDKVKEKIKGHVNLTKNGQLKAKIIKIEGQISSEVEKDIKVEKVLHRNK